MCFVLNWVTFIFPCQQSLSVAAYHRFFMSNLILESDFDVDSNWSKSGPIKNNGWNPNPIDVNRNYAIDFKGTRISHNETT